VTRWLAAALCLCAGTSFAEPTVTIRNNGPVENRINMVVLGDGYTASEMVKYSSDVDVFVSGLFAQSPYKEYASYFNIARVDIVSNQSGADHPENGTTRDTALGAFYNCTGIQRLICVDNSAINAVLSRSVPANARNVIVIIVNDSVYGGSGGAVAVTSTNSQSLEIVAHELGHTIGLLADEYTDTPPPCVNNVEPSQVNAALDIGRASIKWAPWVDTSTVLPTIGTAPGIPGAYQGARYCATGLYRPTYDSKMRSLNRPFEQINAEQMIRRFYNTVSPIDAVTPSSTDIARACGEALDLLVTTPAPADHQLSITWRIDGTQVGTSAGLTVDTSRYPPGRHMIEVEVADTTPAVRRDPSQAMTERHQWTLTTTARVRAAVLGLPSC
jgi:IgA Peptidase M64